MTTRSTTSTNQTTAITTSGITPGTIDETLATAAAHVGQLDIVSITNLVVPCVVGIYPAERTKTQPLVVEIDMWLDIKKATQTESVTDTVDYARVSTEVRQLLVEGEFQLIETAAETIARHVLAATDNGPQIQKARVKVQKPEAIGGGAVAAVEIVRQR